MPSTMATTFMPAAMGSARTLLGPKYQSHEFLIITFADLCNIQILHIEDLPKQEVIILHFLLLLPLLHIGTS